MQSTPQDTIQVAPPSLGLQLLEDVSLLEGESSVEVVTLQEEEVMVRSSTPTPPPDCGKEIVTTRSQVLPEPGWMQDLNGTIESPPSPAPSLSLLSLQQQVRFLEQVPASVELGSQVPAQVLLELLEAPLPDTVSLEEQGSEEPALTGVLPALARLQPPLIPTPVKAPVKEATVVNAESDDEAYACLGGERCVICGERCNTVHMLQEHIMKAHCTQSNQLLDMLKVQHEILNQLLANQSAQENTINNIARTQSVVINDIKELKRTTLSSKAAPPVSSESPPVAAPREIPASKQGPPDTYDSAHQSQVATPNPTLADIVQQSGPGQTVWESPQVQHELQTCAFSILFMGDSIFRNVHMEKIEKQAKSKVTVVKAYSSAYNNNRNNKFKKSNFTDLVPLELNKAKYDSLVMQASSTDLTNYKSETNKEKLRQIAQTSNANMLSVATTAAANHPEVKKVVVFECVPRFDEFQELKKPTRTCTISGFSVTNNSEIKLLLESTTSYYMEALRMSRDSQGGATRGHR